MKVVLDTNVLLAAFATRGLCEAILSICLESHEIVLSEPILAEAKKHLVGKLKMSIEATDQIVEFLRENSLWVVPERISSSVCRDVDDLKILGTAVAADANFLVSGDHDLLVIKRYQSIEILSPRIFYGRLTAPQ